MAAATIECSQCQTILLLSDSLLQQVEGRTGSVTCKGCEQRIHLDWRGPSLSLGGAILIDDLELELDDEPPAEQRISEAHLSDRSSGGDSLTPQITEMNEGQAASPPAEMHRQDDSALPEELAEADVKSVRENSAPSHELQEVEGPSREAHHDSIPSHELQEVEDPSHEVHGSVVSGQESFAPEQGSGMPSERASRKPRRMLWLPAAAAASLLGGFWGGQLGTRLANTESAETPTPTISSVAQGVLSDAEPERAPTKRAEKAHPQEETLRELTVLPEYAAEIDGPSGEAKGDRAPRLDASIRQDNPENSVSPQGEPSQDGEMESERPGALRREAKTASSDVAGVSEAMEEKGAQEPDSADAQEAIEEPSLKPFSKKAARVALNAAMGNALSCRNQHDPVGTAQVVVTFAPSGRVTTATVNGFPFAGTEIGGCVARRFRAARIPAFSGSHVTVRKKVVLK